jgi:transglutaminase-like putative cysteine protease
MHRFRLEHGWTTFWLVSLLVFTATLSVQQAEWADGLHILTPITIIGLLVGILLAHMRQLPPIAAHATALIIGLIVVFFQMTTFLSDSLGSRWDKLTWLWSRWETWWATIRGGESAEDLYLFILMMSGMLWVLSYASIWFVFRSGWIWITLLLPGVIVLLNLGYSSNVSTFVLVLYLFAAILLLMRFHFIQREIRWRREGVPYPDSLLVRGFWTASYLAVILIIAGWMVPFSPQTDRAVAAVSNASAPWDRLEEAVANRFGNVLPGRGGSGGGVGGFASFDSEFELGGSLRLSEEPVVFVEGSEAPYLAAHRYDYFTGTGWETTFESSLNSEDDEDDSSPPLISFDAGQEIPIPDSSRRSTRERTHTVEVLRPQGNIVLSGGEASTVDQDTRVQTGWFMYQGQEINVQSAEEGNTPPDLWNLVSRLKDAEFNLEDDDENSGAIDPQTSPSDDGNSDDADGDSAQSNDIPVESFDDDSRDLWDRIQEDRAELEERGLETEIVLSDELTVESLLFTGPLPVFNDIEAIYASEISSGDEYEVTSLTSEATSEELIESSSAYPVEITDRYMQIPGGYSDRVEQLAFQITDGQDSAYEKATAIEAWLRENLEYSEQITLPPEDVDFIEYFIFESQQGYCTYYATAMAQMLRMVDVPSRVTVGYFPAAYDEDFNGAIYRDRNAHAWVEVYFPGYGWVDFEPTPSQSTISRGSSSDESEMPGDLENDPALGGEMPHDESMMWEEEFAPGEAGRGDLDGLGQEATSTTQWIMRGIAVFLLLAVGIFSFFWLRGLSGLSPAGQFFTRLQRGASWTGIAARPSMTPFEYARSIATAVPGTRTDAEFLAEIYVKERYGNRQLQSPELTRARAAWLRLRGMFVKYALLHRWRKSRRSGGNDW